jgi:murein DD-endopeptidase MepM/ murein hydrolase activator NlpD
LNHVKELVITAGYGNVDSVHKTPHTGIDIAFNLGDPILSPANGIVSRVVDYGASNIGKGIIIKLQDGKELIFGHLSKISVTQGQQVAAGMEIGNAGSTGYSTGVHLHLGCKFHGHFIDPSHYFDLLQAAYHNNIHHISQIASDHSQIYHAVSSIVQALIN